MQSAGSGERERASGSHPGAAACAGAESGKLRQTIQHGAQKAIAAAEETMTAVRDAIGLLRLGAVAGLAAKEEATAALRVPESIAARRTDKERWEIGWRNGRSESKTISSKKDRPELL